MPGGERVPSGHGGVARQRGGLRFAVPRPGPARVGQRSVRGAGGRSRARSLRGAGRPALERSRSTQSRRGPARRGRRGRRRAASRGARPHVLLPRSRGRARYSRVRGGNPRGPRQACTLHLSRAHVARRRFQGRRARHAPRRNAHPRIGKRPPRRRIDRERVDAIFEPPGPRGSRRAPHAARGPDPALPLQGPSERGDRRRAGHVAGHREEPGVRHPGQARREQPDRARGSTWWCSRACRSSRW